MPHLVPRSLAVLPFLALAAACTSDLIVPTSGSGPQCDSTVWMETLVAFSPAPGEPPAELIGQCLDRSPSINDGVVACIVLEGHHQGGACPPCDTRDRGPVAASHAGAVDLARSSTTAVEDELDCFCEVLQLTGAEETACQTDTSDPVLVDGAALDGVCYVDSTTVPTVGSPNLTKNCPLGAKRMLRFLGKAGPVGTENGPVATFMVCQEDVCATAAE